MSEEQVQQAEAQATPEAATPAQVAATAPISISIQQLLEAGVHFGHQTQRWNPKMKPYIFGARNGIYIIDLQKTAVLFRRACAFVSEIVARGGNVLFIGTKKQAQDTIAEEATRAGQFYVNSRWLGGTLTNFRTIKQGIDRFRAIEKMQQDGTYERLPKKEVALLEREREKLEQNLGGIKEMGRLPAALFVIDPRKEKIAIHEANRLGIPVVAVVDTNADPEPIDCVIPGNDDSVNGVKLILDGIAKVIKAANDEYSAKAAEENKRREAERKSRDEAEKAARAERKARATKPSGERRGAKKGIGADVKAAARKAKEAAESKAKADLAAKRKAAVVEAEAAVKAAAPAEAPVEAPAEAPAAEAPAAPAAE